MIAPEVVGAPQNIVVQLRHNVVQGGTCMQVLEEGNARLQSLGLRQIYHWRFSLPCAVRFRRQLGGSANNLFGSAGLTNHAADQTPQLMQAIVVWFNMVVALRLT